MPFKSQQRLKNRVAIVTGAGSGIGREAALRMAAEGAKIGIADISDEKGKATLKAITKAGGKAVFVKTDVSKRPDVQRMVQETVRLLGNPNILVANAGIYHAKDDSVDKVDEAVFDQVLAVNLKGIFLSCKFTLPYMVKGGGGSIIMMSSSAALVGANTVSYSTSKGGVMSLARSVARQYANKGIRANAILPGPIDTPIHDNVRAAAKRTGVPNIASKPNSMSFKQPMLKRWGEPEEVAALIAYLASDESSYITGACLTCDGGFTAV